MPDLDILVTTYNCAEELDECLASLSVQKYGDFNVLVIDNASVDETGDVMDDWMTRDKRISYHRNEQNLGYTDSVNIGYKMSSAEYVLQLHGDDILLPNFLDEVLVKGLKAHPECPFGYSLFSRYIDDLPTGDVHQYLPDLPTGAHPMMPYLCFTNWIIQSFAVFRREAFDRVGAFDRHIARFRQTDVATLRAGYVDHYMWARLSTLGPAWVVDERLGYYRTHAASGSGGFRQRRFYIQEAIRTYDFIFDDHDLFQDIHRYMAKVNQMGRLLTDNGLVRSALEMTRSSETGPEIAPFAHDFLQLIHDTLRTMVFDSNEYRGRIVMETDENLDLLAQTIRDNYPEARAETLSAQSA